MDRTIGVYKLHNPITGADVEHPTNAWKYERATYEKHVKENRLYWGKNGENVYPRLKKKIETENVREELKKSQNIRKMLWYIENANINIQSKLHVPTIICLRVALKTNINIFSKTDFA